MDGHDLFHFIKKTPVEFIDLIIHNNDELQELMLRNAEYIRVKNLEYFEFKKKFLEAKRELEEIEARVTLSLNDKDSRNAETRKAAVKLNPSYTAQHGYTDELSLKVEEIEQYLWNLRHLETTFKMIAELRIIELKKNI